MALVFLNFVNPVRFKEIVKARHIYMYADYAFSNYSSFSTEANLAFNLTFIFDVEALQIKMKRNAEYKPFEFLPGISFMKKRKTLFRAGFGTTGG